MKNLIYISLFSFLMISNSYSQLPQDYPFKTLIDGQNNLLVTGYDLNNDFFVTKFRSSNGGEFWNRSYENPGNDRGMDIAIDSNNNIVYATGYVFNQTTGTNDIMLIKYNGTSGDIIWTRKYADGRDSKAFGIVMDNDKNLYITGYIANKKNLKSDILTVKYSPAGSVLWSRVFNNKDFNLDDVGTHILIDNYFVYVLGYTDQGEYSKKDIVMLTYTLNGDTLPNQFYVKGRTDEIPTSFIITDITRSIHSKSRVAVGSIIDSPGNNNNQRDFLTLSFDCDLQSSLLWAKTFNGEGNGEDVPTAIAKDRNGNVYVTGYSFFNPSRQYDFATIKYGRDSGNYLWNPAVNYFDTAGGNDKASSIKLGNDGRVFIAGTSDSAVSKYYISAFRQVNNTLLCDWSGEFIPDFGQKENENNNKKKAGVVDIDNQGNVWLTTFQWDDNGASYAIRKFGPGGDVIFTIENINNRPGVNSNENTVSTKRNGSIKNKHQANEVKD